MTRGRRLGVMFRREWAPDRLVDVARRVEHNGFDELWVVEDLGFHGGFTQATTALAVTEELRVGLGIAPAAVRNPAYAAMEVATLANLFPGRFHMGFGHGVAGWMAQVGATPVSWVASIEEVTRATIELVSGDPTTVDGRHVHLDDVSLVHPPDQRPPVSLGVIGPKSIDVVRRSADGVILCEGSGPRYVADVRRRIGEDKLITVFLFASTDAAGRRSALDAQLAGGPGDPRLALYGNLDADQLVDELTVGGDPAEWSTAVERWYAAGADSVVLTSLPTDPVDVVDSWIVDEGGPS